MERKIEMKNKLRCGTALGSTGLGMKTINKSLLIITAISTHALHHFSSDVAVQKKRAVRSIFHTEVLYRDKVFATHKFTTASAVKPTERTTKKKQFHVMMKNLFYLIIRIRLHILWYSKMHCRRGER